MLGKPISWFSSHSCIGAPSLSVIPSMGTVLSTSNVPSTYTPQVWLLSFSRPISRPVVVAEVLPSSSRTSSKIAV